MFLRNRNLTSKNLLLFNRKRKLKVKILDNFYKIFAEKSRAKKFGISKKVEKVNYSEITV